MIGEASVFWFTQRLCLLKHFYSGLLPERQSHGHGASSSLRRDLSYEWLGENKHSSKIIG